MKNRHFRQIIGIILFISTIGWVISAEAKTNPIKKHLPSISHPSHYRPALAPVPEEAATLANLHQAKLSGNHELVLQLEHELAVLRHQPISFIPSADFPSASQGFKTCDGSNSNQEKWFDDCNVSCFSNFSAEQSISPSLTTDKQGGFIVSYIDLPVDGTTYWYFNCSYYSCGDLSNGGIGFEYRVPPNLSQSTTLVQSLTDTILVTCSPSILLNNPILIIDQIPMSSFLDYSEFIFPFEASAQISNPQLISDNDEYFDNWYLYLVFNLCDANGLWHLMFSRTADYGLTWSTPVAIVDYWSSGLVFDASESLPDIDFGSGRLYVTFENYSSSTSTDQGVFILSSNDFGATWEPPFSLALENFSLYSPVVTSARGSNDHPVVVVACSMEYSVLDHDIIYSYSEDGGVNWSGWFYITSSSSMEKNVVLAASPTQGMVHLAFWSEDNIFYAQAPFDDLTNWNSVSNLSVQDTAIDLFRPAISVDPTLAPEFQGEVAWVDSRNGDWEIYYTSATFPDPAPVSDQTITRFALGEPFPNPCFSNTQVSFSIPEQFDSSAVSFAVFDVRGHKIRDLLDHNLVGGNGTARWDGRNDKGQSVASGMYFIRMQIEDRLLSKRVMLMR